MTLIADGGSTKCDWVLLDNAGKILLKTTTKGLNPTVVPPEELQQRIKKNLDFEPFFNEIKTVDFYGAGCGTVSPRSILQNALSILFPNAKVSVKEDLIAAVYSVTTKPGIVCILGTGSNSCYFDGEKIHTPIPSLGYIVMDEASGNYFGKKLLKDYFYNKMPTEIAKAFKTDFNLDPDYIKMNLYKMPNPNAFLASFAEFIFNRNKINPYFYGLLKEGIQVFTTDRILCYKEAKSVPVHFIGSIAHFSEKIINEVFLGNSLELGKIVQKPIDGLTEYYKIKIKNKKS